MNQTFSIFDVFSLFCGLAIFLYGMQQGEKNLRSVGGSDLRKLISIITRHRLSAYIAGLFTTLITQSSTATTVILVSFASARLITLGQSLGMILGSDLGTTFTLQLFAFKFYQIAPLMIATGFFSTLSDKNQKVYAYGKLVMAMGFIFFGMHMMTQSVIPLRSLPAFEQSMHNSLINPWYGILAGTMITAIIHSSAATLAILIALIENFNSVNGWTPSAVNFFPIILGANLGTCLTAFIATFKAELEGVRVAWAHFLFKFLGIIIVFPFIGMLKYLNLFSHGSVALQIAVYHTLFNLIISILFLPFLNLFEQLILKFVKSGKKEQKKYRVNFLHEQTLSLPVLALSQAIKEIEVMSERVTMMVENCKELIDNFDVNRKIKLVDADDEVDFLHENIITFLTRISREELKPEQATRAYELIMITTDLEHIGDSASKTIAPLTEKIQSSPLPLSEEGKREIIDFFDNTVSNLKEAAAAFVLNDQALASTVFQRKKQVYNLYDHLFDRHMNRLYLRKPESLQTTSIHSDLLEELRRINDFTFRIAAHILNIYKIE
ncbi:MAG TPA: Na/Pi cotransporter family protein [Chitinispirillaceae bacterium]|nr:Na/Pi cotransporter family protein [Chitinispirillaceae bacterium]